MLIPFCAIVRCISISGVPRARLLIHSADVCTLSLAWATGITRVYAVIKSFEIKMK